MGGEVAEKHTLTLTTRLGNSDPFIRMAAAEALGRMRELAHPYCGVLAARLQDNDPYVRMTAADALSRLGEEGAHALASHLSSDDPMVRRSIARSLGKMSEDAHPHVPDLATKLEDGDMRVQLTAWDALVSIDEAATPANTNVNPWSAYESAATPRFIETSRQSIKEVSLSTSGRGRFSASPAWTSSPRARMTGAALLRRAAAKDPLAQYAAAARLTGRVPKPGATELELLGLDDIKISSQLGQQRATAAGRLDKKAYGS